MKLFTDYLQYPVQFYDGELITPSMVLTKTLVAAANSKNLYCCGETFTDIGRLLIHEGMKHLPKK